MYSLVRRQQRRCLYWRGQVRFLMTASRHSWWYTLIIVSITHDDGVVVVRIVSVFSLIFQSRRNASTQARWRVSSNRIKQIHLHRVKTRRKDRDAEHPDSLPIVTVFHSLQGRRKRHSVACCERFVMYFSKSLRVSIVSDRVHTKQRARERIKKNIYLR